MKDIRIKEHRFDSGSITSNSNGLFNVYSDQSINGVLQSVTLSPNSYTETGSILLFESGTFNTLLLQLRAGSVGTCHIFTYGTDQQGVTGSPYAFVQPVLNGPLRVVGSGLGNGTSGLAIVARYI